MTTPSFCKQHFTLMEVLIAVAILGISMTMTLSIIGNAQADLLRAERQWGRAKLLSSVSEVFLLGGPEIEIPADLLPEGFHAECTIEKIEDDLPDHAIDPQHGWVLAEFVITLYGANGDELGIYRVKKMVREDDL